MKVHRSGQSDPIFLLFYAVWLAFPVFCLLFAGCFSTRDYTAWSDPNKPAGQYAILPVVPAQVRITVESSRANDPYEISLANSNVKNQEEVARIINEVLDTIASRENNALEGPGKVHSTLKLSPDWKNFQVYIQDPGPFHEPWKREGLATITRELGYQRVLCVNPTLQFKPNLSFRVHENDPLGYHWDGRITVEVDMMDLAAAKVVASGAGEADFYGHIGVFVIGGYDSALVIPYAFGKAFDRAVDQTIRQALAELFSVASKGGSAK